MKPPTIKLFLLALFLAISFVNCFPRNYRHSPTVQKRSDIRTFEQFKHFFKKQYPSSEAEGRARKFFDELIEFSKDPWNSFKYEITSIDDMPIEFPQQYGRSMIAKGPLIDSPKLREHFNWTEKLQLSYAPDNLMYQGKCGSCWLFAAAAVLEANLAKRCHHNPPVLVSRQEILDCSVRWAPNQNHCSKGKSVYTAFDYVYHYGVHTEKDYPLLENSRYRKSHQCRQLDVNKTRHVTGNWQTRSYLSDEKLQEIIRIYGPVVVQIKSKRSFVNYKGGVYTDCQPDYNVKPHAVVVVGWGYDEESKLPYWIVRNSWKNSWGEHGHARVQRRKNCMKMNEFVYFLLDEGTNIDCVYDADNAERKSL